MVDSNSYFKDRMNRYPKMKNLNYADNSWDELEILCKRKLFEKFGTMPPENINKELIMSFLLLKNGI